MKEGRSRKKIKIRKKTMTESVSVIDFELVQVFKQTPQLNREENSHTKVDEGTNVNAVFLFEENERQTLHCARDKSHKTLFPESFIPYASHLPEHLGKHRC